MVIRLSYDHEPDNPITRMQRPKKVLTHTLRNVPSEQLLAELKRRKVLIDKEILYYQTVTALDGMAEGQNTTLPTLDSGDVAFEFLKGDAHYYGPFTARVLVTAPNVRTKHVDVSASSLVRVEDWQQELGAVLNSNGGYSIPPRLVGYQPAD